MGKTDSHGYNSKGSAPSAHLCGLGSLCLSRSCLIMRYRPMRMSGLDTFMPFREILEDASRWGFSVPPGHQGRIFSQGSSSKINLSIAK